MEGLEEELVGSQGSRLPPDHRLHGDFGRGLSVRDFEFKQAVGAVGMVKADAQADIDVLIARELEGLGQAETVAVILGLAGMVGVGLHASVGSPHRSHGETVDAVGASAAGRLPRAATEAGELAAPAPVEVRGEADHVREDDIVAPFEGLIPSRATFGRTDVAGGVIHPPAITCGT